MVDARDGDQMVAAGKHAGGRGDLGAGGGGQWLQRDAQQAVAAVQVDRVIGIALGRECFAQQSEEQVKCMGIERLQV